MTKSMVMAAVALTALTAAAACSPQAASGPSAAEKRLATKIVDAGGVIPLDDGSLEQFVGQQVMMQGGLSHDQMPQAMVGIKKNVEEAIPKLKEAMAASLTEQFNVKELDLLYKFLTSKEGKAIQEKMGAVMETSSQAAQAAGSAAANKALAEIKAAWPSAPATPAPGEPAAPAGPGAPAAPAAEPAKPN